MYKESIWKRTVIPKQLYRAKTINDKE